MGEESEWVKYLGGISFFRNDPEVRQFEALVERGPAESRETSVPAPRSRGPASIGRNWDMDPVVPKYGDVRHPRTAIAMREAGKLRHDERRFSWNKSG